MSTKDTTLFRSATGSLLYLSGAQDRIVYGTDEKPVNTRSGSDDQDEEGFEVPERHYFDWINYSEDTENGDELNANVDVDHGGDLDEGYSTTGVVVCLAGAPIDGNW